MLRTSSILLLLVLAGCTRPLLLDGADSDCPTSTPVAEGVRFTLIEPHGAIGRCLEVVDPRTEQYDPETERQLNAVRILIPDDGIVYVALPPGEAYRARTWVDDVDNDECVWEWSATFDHMEGLQDVQLRRERSCA